MYTRNPEVPQTPASLAQMSLAQRAEQAVLQERALEGQNDQGHGGEPHTVTIVGSGAGGNGLGSGGTIQVRGLGQMAAGATLQLAQLAGGQVVHILQPVGTERGEGVVTLQGGSQLTQIRLVDARENAALLEQVGRQGLT